MVAEESLESELGGGDTSRESKQLTREMKQVGKHDQ
jgi:hypothetical protein